MSKYKVVLTGNTWPKALKRIEEHCEIKKWDKQNPIPRDLLLDWLRDAEGLFSTNEVMVDEELLAAAPNLRVVTQSSVGYDNIDITACHNNGVVVGNTPEVLVNATADLAFGILLTAVRRIHTGWELVKNGSWEQKGSNLGLYGHDLQDKTLGIVGLGAIGAAVSKRARAFGLNVIYYNRNRRPDDDSLQIKYSNFDNLLKQSDIVMSLVPLYEGSKGLFGKEQFAMMKSSAYFINASRGGIVDTEALCQALANNEIAYAALDVTDPEPVPVGHPLLELSNILITPHIGSATYETRNEMANLAVDNLLAGLRGEPLAASVTPK